MSTQSWVQVWAPGGNWGGTSPGCIPKTLGPLWGQFWCFFLPPILSQVSFLPLVCDLLSFAPLLSL